MKKVHNPFIAFDRILAFSFTCLVLILFSLHTLNAKDRQIVHMQPSENLEWDTLNVQFENGLLYLTIDILNHTNKRTENHFWLFSENVSIEPTLEQESLIDEDMNAVRMQKSLMGLELSIVPRLNEVPSLVIKPPLSEDFVYKAKLKYPILAFEWRNEFKELTLLSDTIISGRIKNLGLDTLMVLTKLHIESDSYVRLDTIAVPPQKESVFELNIPFYHRWVLSDTNIVHAQLELINLDIKPNRIVKEFDLKIEPYHVGKKQVGSVYFFLLIFISISISILFVSWYFLRSKIGTPRKEALPKPLIRPLSLKEQLIQFKKEHTVKEWNELFKGIVDQVANENQTAPKPQNNRKAPKQFLRKAIVQREQLAKYINDEQLHEKLQQKGEVDLIKYIESQFKDAEVLRQVLAINPKWSKYTVKKQVERLQVKQKSNPEPTILPEKKLKTIKAEPIKLNLPVDEEYIAILNQVNNLLADIISLPWDENPSLLFLKNKFLNYLGIRENKLEAYLHRLKTVPGLAQGQMDYNELNRFVDVFTDVFNLQSFVQVEPFSSLFYTLDFPSLLYSQYLESLRLYWESNWSLKIVIPTLFKDFYQDGLHSNSDDVSKILAENVVDIKYTPKKGLIKDYSSIGLFSKPLKIAKKAAVYTER